MFQRLSMAVVATHMRTSALTWNSERGEDVVTDAYSMCSTWGDINSAFNIFEQANCATRVDSAHEPCRRTMYFSPSSPQWHFEKTCFFQNTRFHKISTSHQEFWFRSSIYQWIGLRENLQETNPIFPLNMGFSGQNFPLNQYPLVN